MPTPLSVTVIVTRPSSRRAPSVTWPPGGVWRKRVGGEVLHRLLEAMRIADHPDIVVRLDDDLDALVLRRLGVTLRHALEDLVDVDVVLLEGNAAGLEARQIEQVADQPLDALAFFLDHLDGALPFPGSPARTAAAPASRRSRESR